MASRVAVCDLELRRQLRASSLDAQGTRRASFHAAVRAGTHAAQLAVSRRTLINRRRRAREHLCLRAYA